jgi:hypothetical protein
MMLISQLPAMQLITTALCAGHKAWHNEQGAQVDAGGPMTSNF